MSTSKKRILQLGLYTAFGASALLLSRNIAFAECGWNYGDWGGNQLSCECNGGGGVITDMGSPPNTVHTLVVNTYAGDKDFASTEGYAWRPNGTWIRGFDDGVGDDSWTHNEAVDWTFLACQNRPNWEAPL